MSRLCCSCHQA